MDTLRRRFLLALAFCFPLIAAGPPAVNHLPVPARSFPSEQELNEFLEPKPPCTIPDDPPPHEGALIDIPYIIEPPDLLLVEVLEALPGRPLSGERLVRPDGMISLGFYGDVYVKGLTIEQAKAKVLLHLRNFVNDDYLGVYRVVAPAMEPLPPPPDAESVWKSMEGDEPRREAEAEAQSSAIEPLHDEAPPVKHQRKGPRKRRRKRTESLNSLRSSDHTTTPSRSEANPKPSVPNAPHTGDTDAPPARLKPLDPPVDESTLVEAIHPADSDRLFVDVTAYNSKVYYVLGDVAKPGRMPCTGSETVLDALNYGGGFVATANRKDVRLIRPSRGDRPARIYRVDYDAITEKGDPKTNYQLFPGDRLVVGRNEIAQKTIEIDRLAAPLQTIFNTILQYSFMARSVQNLGTAATGANAGASSLTEAQRKATLEVWAEFWSQALAEQGGVTFDETKLRNALLRALERSKPKDEDANPQ